MLSFKRGFTDFTPEPFPLSTFRDDIVIALYWDDHDVRQNGAIYSRVTDNFFLLSEVGSKISEAFSTNFRPTSLFIATWEEIQRFFGGTPVSFKK